jgi:hypothetical protein
VAGVAQGRATWELAYITEAFADAWTGARKRTGATTRMVDGLDDRSGTFFLTTTFASGFSFAFAFAFSFSFAVVIFVFVIVVVITLAVMAMIAMHLAQPRGAVVIAAVLGDSALRRRKQQRHRCHRCNKCECRYRLDSAHYGLRLLCLFQRCRNVVRHVDRHIGDTFSKATTLAVSSMCLRVLN